MPFTCSPIYARSSSLSMHLGILTALSQPSPDALRTAIRETRRLTSKPFGVNITLLPTINPPDYQGYARAAVEEGVRIFETAGNNRESFLPLHEWRCTSRLPSGSAHQILQDKWMHCDSQVHDDPTCFGAPFYLRPKNIAEFVYSHRSVSELMC